MNLKPKKIAVLDHTTPARRRVRRKLDDGTEVVERVPWQRFLKAVNLAGAVVRIPLFTHRANSEEQDPYKHYQEHTKVRKGFIPYGVCPMTLPWEIQGEFLPAEMRNKQPCHKSLKGGRISADECCACIEDLITHRKGEQAARMAKIEIKTEQMLAAEASRSMATAVKGIADVVADLKAKSEAPSKRPARSVDD